MGACGSIENVQYPTIEMAELDTQNKKFFQNCKANRKAKREATSAKRKAEREATSAKRKAERVATSAKRKAERVKNGLLSKSLQRKNAMRNVLNATPSA